MFGQNFISVLSVVTSAYDKNSVAPDSLDARFLTIPQRRGFFLGSTIMNRANLFYYGKNDKNGRGKALTPLFASDPGTTTNPDLPSDQPDHNVLREYIMAHFLGEKQVAEAINRQKAETGQKLLKEFGERAKGKSGDELEQIIENWLPPFLLYTLFDVPLDAIPMEDVLASYVSIKFVFNLYGPEWIKICSSMNTPIRSSLDKVAVFLAEHSKVLKDVPDGPDGLTKDDLIEAIHMLFGIAAFQGTRALANACMTQMPKGYAEQVVQDEEEGIWALANNLCMPPQGLAEQATTEYMNPSKLRNAILECARLDAPVTGAHCIVDDKDGLTTVIGGKRFKFPRGTILFTGMTIANLDKNRFPNPFVFDPENRDFSKLTSFNSIGESTNPNAPRICPGRNFAVSAIELMMKAKIAAGE